MALDFEMLSLPETLQVLLVRFVSMVWSTSLESTVGGLPDLEILATQAKFLEPSGYCTMINCFFFFRIINYFQLIQCKA